MQRLFGVLLLFILTVNLSRAQQPVGFSNPDNFKHILDYRLPDWGYSNFFLDFSLNGGSRDIKTNSIVGSSDSHSRGLDLFASPGYDIFRESEERIFRSEIDFQISYRDNKRDRDSGISRDIRNHKSLSSQIGAGASLREYIGSNWFVLLREDVSIEYLYNSRENRDNGVVTARRELYDRNFFSDSRVGIGVGRVRNVNPVIRAVRLNERYKTVSGGQQFSDEELRSVANEFTRFQGYQSRYDRPEKYFWQSVDRAVNSSISELNAFDLFYLTDVLNETIGSRLQGWDASAGGVFLYTNSMERIENNSTVDRTLNITKNAGFFGQFRWFENLSLQHQIGFSAIARQSYPIDSESDVKWDSEILAIASWLWNVTDRYLLNTQLFNRYNALKMQRDSFGPEHRRWTLSSVLNGNMIYFIENRLAMNAGISFMLKYDGDTNSEFAFDGRVSGFHFNAGLRYYFNRNLY